MSAVGAVFLVAVLLIVLALVYFLVSTIVALRKITAGLEGVIEHVGGIVSKSAPVEEVVTAINAQLDAGVHAIGKKIVEEAAEVWMAAEYESDAAAAEEISQLLYHLQTLMLAKGLSLEDVYRHL